jgi:hypothetical protein
MLPYSLQALGKVLKLTLSKPYNAQCQWQIHLVYFVHVCIHPYTLNSISEIIQDSVSKLIITSDWIVTYIM